MKKHSLTNLFFIIILVFSADTLAAQNFRGSIITGLSTSQIDGDEYSGYNKLGFYAGVSVERPLGNVVGIKTELYYISKGAKQNVDGYEIHKTSLNYVELPLMVTFLPFKQVEFDFGMAFSYLIKARMWSMGEEYPEGVVDIKDMQYSAIVTGSYFFSEHIAFNVRFDYAFLPIKENPNWYSNNFSFGILYRFN